MADFPKTIGSSFIRVKDSGGNVIRESSGNPIAAELISKDLDFGMRQMQKYVDVVIAEVTDAEKLGLVRLEYSHRDSLSDTLTKLAPPFTLDELARALFLRVTDRYHKISIQSDSVGVAWRLGSLEFYGTGHGRRF